ncbi:uncharacterized protein BJ212DRAFT_1016075 [Suillus subaureus]|uniref:Zn(2)-C6 fungal-type domain-containing protein n=1 Tax=Suillus subaureus TaxID=48587 RepID=A0A9P7JG54_9AGAM|nr:uncharacterized protein BJ212DRAFT_1016075 [Suillus subaureus]KAG1820280.1 hypothetical protein BJ212DRAFT_1016075 [Suillus subaureus]
MKFNLGSFHDLTMSNHSGSGNMIDPATHSSTSLKPHLCRFQSSHASMALSLFCCHIRGADIVRIFMDPAMSASAIAMQHRAPQACKSCRKLKRKCVFNPTLGICNRCSETNKPCVYAEVNSTAPHDDSVAVVHHNTFTMSTNAGTRVRLMFLARHLHPSTEASGHLNASLQQGNPLYLDPANWLDGYGQPNVHTVDMGPGSGDMTAYPSTHPGGQN